MTPTRTVAALRRAGCVFAEEEAALLHDHATGPDHLARLVAARVDGVPLEQLLGWAELDGVRVRTAPGVFVPRRRSRVLTRAAAALAAAVAADRTPVVVDLCCGSGALGAVVAHRVPRAEVHAGELDPAAVACARRNLPPDRVHEGDLYDALPPHLRGAVDVLVVNAPYVPTHAIATMPPEARDHENRVALDGGDDGLAVQARVAAGAGAWLGPGGVLLLETGRPQLTGTAALLAAVGLVTEVLEDAEVGGFAILARRGPTSP